MIAKTGYTTGLRSIRRYMVAGLIAGALLVFGIGGWMATAELAGAVIAHGTVVVVSNVKKVQHPSGGIIGSILVKEGQRVLLGTPLLRLDDTITRANLAVVEKSHNELLVRQARLIGERDSVMDIVFPKILNERTTDPAIRSLMEGERRLFEFRRVAREGKKASIKERIEQFEQEVIGYLAQIGAKIEELALVEQELNAARALWQQKLVSLSKLTALEREATRIKGEKGQLISGMAQTKGRIAEARLSILQIDHDLNSEVASELRDIDGKLGEIQERDVAARDQLKHIELASPQDGTIHELAVHTIGGVVAPGEVLMFIVPSGENLEVETQVSPADVDQLHIGAEALLRLTAFNQRTTPELVGRLSRISADIAFDQKIGASFYRARITIEAGELAKLRGLELVPGMPVEVFVKTEDRKVFSLLLKPFTDQLYRAFREN